MHFSFRFILTPVILCLLFFCGPSSASSQAWSVSYLEDLSKIDEIFFEAHTPRIDPNLPIDLHRVLSPAVQSGLDAVFKDEKWVAVGPAHTSSDFPSLEHLQKPNVAILDVAVSLRRVDIGRSPNLLASVTTRLFLTHKKIYIDDYNVSIPFAFSNDNDENYKNIQKAVELLTGHIPGRMRCARKLEPYDCSGTLHWGGVLMTPKPDSATLSNWIIGII